MARHYGTIGLAAEEVLSRAYDDIAEETAMYPAFYSWIATSIKGSGLPFSAALLDIGCGTGRMLEELANTGYRDLAGLDFSAECVAISKGRMPKAKIWQHNIMDGPIGRPVDAVLMSEVIEHVSDPHIALANIARSLPEGGYLFLSFPNRLAFWPLYHLGCLLPLLPDNQRLRHWFRWFTLPYEMWSSQPQPIGYEVSLQPIDHAYSVREVRRFLVAAGFRVVGERGFRLWPMLRIAGLEWTMTVTDFAERTIGRLVPRRFYYRYMFVCRRA